MYSELLRTNLSEKQQITTTNLEEIRGIALKLR